jgi:DNA-binding NtrC family response regulator
VLRREVRTQPGEQRPSLREIANRAIAEAEQQAIRLALQAAHGNKSEAARLLRTDYKTLHLKMKQYGIPAAQFNDITTDG